MSDPTPALMTALNFTEADLAANRRGVLSERQREILTQQRWPSLSDLFSHYVAVGLLVATIFLGILGNPLTNPHGSWGFLLLLIPLAACYVVLLVPRRQRLNADLASGQVEAATGFPQLQAKTVRRGRSRRIDTEKHTLKLGTNSFPIRWQTYQRLKLDYAYHRVYYAPNSKLILSMEKVDR